MRLTGSFAVDVTASSSAMDDQSKSYDAPALDEAAFAACMAPLEPFENRPFLAIAVSGGADSLALTLLADRWAKHRGGRVAGLTVDHGLRSSSAEEALKIGRWLQDRQIEHHILPWLDEKPETGIQQRARDARYALLAGWCRQQNCLHLLTGHHRRDQAETVALRKARQSGVAGLAAMAAVRELPGLRLLRPLLGIDKAILFASLQAAAQPWLDDPSNDSPAFTRNRFRHAGLDVQALADEAEKHGIERREANRRAADALVRYTTLDPAGFAMLDAAGFDLMGTDLALDLLRRLLMTVGGRVYPPRRQALLRLFNEMRAEKPSGARTLACCRIQRHRHRWLICRERASSSTAALQPGRRQHWDDRFAICLKAERQGVVVKALGDRARIGRNTLMQKEKHRDLPGVVRVTVPSIWEERKLIAIPHLGLFDESVEPDQLDVRFCPHHPLANAPFMPHISSLRLEPTVAPPTC